MIKQKPIYVCDFCNKEVKNSFVVTVGVPYEGYSEIHLSTNERKCFEVGDGHYCNLDCLVKSIKEVLGI